jgi:hypothetical protein
MFINKQIKVAYIIDVCVKQQELSIAMCVTWISNIMNIIENI